MIKLAYLIGLIALTLVLMFAPKNEQEQTSSSSSEEVAKVDDSKELAMNAHLDKAVTVIVDGKEYQMDDKNKVVVVPPVKKEERPKDPFKDKKFSAVYPKNKESDREARPGVAKNPPAIPAWYNPGGKKLDNDLINRSIRAVYKRLPNIKSSENLVALMRETILVESDDGRLIDPKTGDYGMCQIRERTAKETLQYLKEMHPDVHEAVVSFQDQNKDLVYNLKHNIPFAIALGVEYYWIRHSSLNTSKAIASHTERAKLWKTVYNTRLGLGTVNAYKKRSAPLYAQN